MRRLSTSSVVVALATAGVIWFSSEWWTRARAVTVQRIVAGRQVNVQEFGRGGPAIVVLSSGLDLSVLASQLAEDHRVVLVPFFGDESAPPAWRTVLEDLGLTADATLVVPLRTAVLPLFEAVASTPGSRIRLVALDDGSAGDADIDRMLDRSQDVVAFLSPSGRFWGRFRSGRSSSRVQVVLVEACDGGISAACMNEVAALLPLSLAAAMAAPTGASLQDAMLGRTPAPGMVVVPLGQFVAGRTDRVAALDSVLRQSVRLGHPLAAARTETTVAEFRAFIDATGYQVENGCWYHTLEQEWKFAAGASWSAPVFEQTPDHPVTCVALEDAEAYAAWISAQTGHAYRLPTETEFEFLNRGGHSGDYGFELRDPAELCGKANGADRASGFAYANPCSDGFAATAPVGSYPPNAFGLTDTTGNLWELTTDCAQSDYDRALWNLIGVGPLVDWGRRGRCQAMHVVRGGSYLSSPANLRVLNRAREGYRSARTGFRLLRQLP